MTKTLDEFFQSREELQFLLSNLQANMQVYCAPMDTEDQEGLMRVNLIMIRQCLNSFGIT
jgi:hypothetical protein